MHTPHVVELPMRLEPVTSDVFVAPPPVSAMTLRRALHSREGVQPTEDAIRRGLRGWAVERVTRCATSDYRQTTIVVGRSRSDALRRASAPARLGEETAVCTTLVAEITSGWDAPLVWPFPPAERTL